MASRKLLAAAFALAALSTLVALGIRDRETPAQVAKPVEPVAAAAPAARAPDASPSRRRPGRPDPASSSPAPRAKSIREEIRDSDDLFATYEKYRDTPDATGEFSYRFARALADCSVILRRAFDRAEAYANGAGHRGDDAEARHATLLRALERCGRFEAWEPARVWALVRDLYATAEAVSYPPAVARSLRREMHNRGIEGSDAIATNLLSNSLDADIIPGIIDYLRARDGSGWWRTEPDGVDRQVRQASWVLLQCSLGADCGPTSRPVLFGCAFNAFCSAISVEEAFLAQGLTPAQLESAYAHQREIAVLIRNRQWDRLGFVVRPSRSS